MANYLGTPWEGRPVQYQSDVPLELTNRAMDVNQAATDAMRQKTQGVLDNLGNTQFYKDSDREIVNQRIKETVDNLNKFAGPDLTDGRTQSQLMGVVNGLSNDPEVLDRIAANRNAAKQLQRIQTIKEKHPDQYSGVNENWFMKQFHQWRSDPSKTSFDATYQPFNDYGSDMNNSMELTLKNPDIQEQVNYTIDPATGDKIPRPLYHGVGSTVSVKEMAAQKLYEGLQSSWTGANDGQLQLEYNNAMVDNGPAIALNHVSLLAQDYNTRLNHYNALVGQAKAKGVDSKEYETKRDEYKAKLAMATTAAEKLASGEVSPNDLVSYDQYKHDKLWSAAEAHAFRQEGKPEWNPVDLALLKHRMDQEDIATAAKLKNTNASSSSTAPNTELANVVESVYGPSGKATGSMPTFKAFLGVSDRPEEKGYVSKTFANEPIFASLAPIISQVIPTADQKMQYGYTKLNNDFAVWKQMNIARGGYQTYTKPDSAGYQWPTGTHATGEHPVQELTINDYIAALKQSPDAADIYKSQYGMDLNDPSVLNNASKVSQKATELAGITRSTGANITGTMPMRPITGDNIIRDSGGRPVVGAISAPMTAAQLWPILGNGDVELGKKLFDTYQSQGSIRLDHPNSDYVKDGKVDGTANLYTFTMHIPVNQDIRSVASNYTRDATTAGVYKDSGPDIANDVVSKYTSGVRRSQYTPAMLAQQVAEIAQAKPAQKERLTELLDMVNNPALNDETRGQAQDIINAAHYALKQSKTK